MNYVIDSVFRKFLQFYLKLLNDFLMLLRPKKQLYCKRCAFCTVCLYVT